MEHEALMQKYLHLLQIVETEKTVAKQLRQQIEDGQIEIERLKAEVTASQGSPGQVKPQTPPTSVFTKYHLKCIPHFCAPELLYIMQGLCYDQTR